jgi:HAD superfamily 5'-nucleotidase-like hydrolase
MNTEIKNTDTIPYERRIFVNRGLRMEHIQAVGFDMDYTLAIYKEAAEYLTWEMSLKRLIKEYLYPPEALELRYRPDFSIRGLVIDTHEGNILKLDGHKFVQRGVHGTSPLSHDEIRALYRNTLLRFKTRSRRFVAVDSLFERPEVHMYASMIDLLETKAGKKLKRVDYKRLFWAIRNSVDGIHADGSLKQELVKSMPTYFHKDPDLATTLHQLRSAGKHLFLLTNSEWWYVNQVMSYLLDGMHRDYHNWQQFFDLIIVKAGKPGFFTSKDPFVELDQKGDTIDVADRLEKGRIYQGGNIQDFEDKWDYRGDTVLYVGDNIFSDIVRSKKRTTWRTALIVPEMEQELVLLEKAAWDTKLITQEERLLSDLRLRLHALRLREKQGGRSLHIEVEETKNRLRRLEQDVRRQEHAVLKLFNPLFGMLFKECGEHSLFGAQMEDYACVYTSRVSNLGLYSPMEYFKSPRDLLPHEIPLVQ